MQLQYQIIDRSTLWWAEHQMFMMVMILAQH